MLIGAFYLVGEKEKGDDELYGFGGWLHGPQWVFFKAARRILAAPVLRTSRTCRTVDMDWAGRLVLIG